MVRAPIFFLPPLVCREMFDGVAVAATAVARPGGSHGLPGSVVRRAILIACARVDRGCSGSPVPVERWNMHSAPRGCAPRRPAQHPNRRALMDALPHGFANSSPRRVTAASIRAAAGALRSYDGHPSWTPVPGGASTLSSSRVSEIPTFAARHPPACAKRRLGSRLQSPRAAVAPQPGQCDVNPCCDTRVPPIRRRLTRDAPPSHPAIAIPHR